MQGSTKSNNEYIYAHHSSEDITAMMDAQQVDVLVMGHTHVSFIKRKPSLQGGPEKLAVNCGSVGSSKEEKPLASYLLLNINEQGVDATIIKLTTRLQKPSPPYETAPFLRFYAKFLELQLASSLSENQ